MAIAQYIRLCFFLGVVLEVIYYKYHLFYF